MTRLSGDRLACASQPPKRSGRPGHFHLVTVARLQRQSPKV